MLLIEYQYFPPITVIKTSISLTHIGISSYDSFVKMSFRNRCIIPTANGLCNLSVPLVGGRENGLPIKDVRIDNSVKWQLRHWRTISSAYGRSPWFEFYAETLERYFLRRFTFLADWDIELLHWVFTCLGSQVTIEILDKEPENMVPESVIDYRNKIFPKNFQSVAGIPAYTQVFQEKIGFQPNMSIIDLIFCEGKNAGRCLR
jgi:hypothetical protein